MCNMLPENLSDSFDIYIFKVCIYLKILLNLEGGISIMKSRLSASTFSLLLKLNIVGLPLNFIFFYLIIPLPIEFWKRTPATLVRAGSLHSKLIKNCSVAV